MIMVTKDVTADNSDVLAGTDLENIPEPGVLRLYTKSTASDSKFSVRATGQASPVVDQTIQKGTDAVVSIADDIPVDIPVLQGKYIVAVDITTAATVRVVAVFYSIDEAAAEAA